MIPSITITKDPKFRFWALFVGAVLLPTIALSYVSFNFIPRLARGNEVILIRQAERLLADIDADLEGLAEARALRAAETVGTELLLEGRSEVIRAALQRAGFGTNLFKSLHLEASTPRPSGTGRVASRGEVELHDLLRAADEMPDLLHEGAVAWRPRADGGVLRFEYTTEYVHQHLVPEYFAEEFATQERKVVVRVSDRHGLIYETEPTPSGRFEVEHRMQSPTFRGVKLFLRYRDQTIAQDVRAWELGMLALIGFIDVLLGAGLVLIYKNVRREMHLSRLKSDFVANVSHELKTPLALIRLFAETLELGRVPSADKAHQYYSVIHKESQRLTRLINNILDFSRIEAGRREYRFAPTDVVEVIQEVLDSYRFQLEQQGFSVRAQFPETSPTLDADAEALSQAVLNLLNNAVKYSPRERSISLDVSIKGTDLVISVRDRGIGIALEEQEKIFEKFYRAEDSLVHETKGSGLGLALVRHIVQAHGGRVEVESQLGQGSTFRLVLPLERGSEE